MTAERLNEIMAQHYSYITYDPKLAEEYLECGAPKADEDTIAWCFADYLLSQDLAEYVNKAEKFIIFKTIGNYGPHVVREFDDEESAKLFVSLMRESEQYDFVRYRITKVINF